MSHRHNFVTISGRKFTENAEKPGRRAPERVPLPGFLSIKWHVVFKMKAHRRPVSGCGSQRMLHALERRSHPADHGPSFASLFPPLAAVSSAAIPVRVKLKIPRANAAAATTLDIPSRWDPRANQSPTGALVAVLRTAALSRVVVPSVCFTPWSGVRIPLTTAPASLPCFRRWRRSAQLQFPCGSN